MASPKIIHTTDNDFDRDVLGASTPVLVDFWATWCGPCRAIAPHLDALADELDGSVTIAKVDIDQHPNVASRYGVQSIPTLLLFENGELVDKMVGNPGAKSKIAAFITKPR